MKIREIDKSIRLGNMIDRTMVVYFTDSDTEKVKIEKAIFQ